MLTVIFSGRNLRLLPVGGLVASPEGNEEKFDYLTQLLLAPPTEEYRQN
jgi:hypothetical protein